MYRIQYSFCARATPEGGMPWSLGEFVSFAASSRPSCRIFAELTTARNAPISD
jgi:hypothetical protein